MSPPCLPPLAELSRHPSLRTQGLIRQLLNQAQSVRYICFKRHIIRKESCWYVFRHCEFVTGVFFHRQLFNLPLESCASLEYRKKCFTRNGIQTMLDKKVTSMQRRETIIEEVIETFYFSEELAWFRPEKNVQKIKENFHFLKPCSGNASQLGLKSVFN